MELKDAIAQLEDLIKDRKSFIVDDNSIEWNEIWLRDIEALKIGIAAIKRLLEKGGRWICRKSCGKLNRASAVTMNSVRINGQLSRKKPV